MSSKMMGFHSNQLFCPWNHVGEGSLAAIGSIKELARFSQDLSIDCSQRSLKLVWLCHQLLSRFLAKGHLPQVSHLPANDKVGNEMKPGLCTDLLAFTLQSRKTSARSAKSSEMGSFTPPVGLHSKTNRTNEGKKKGWVGIGLGSPYSSHLQLHLNM